MRKTKSKKKKRAVEEESSDEESSDDSSMERTKRKDKLALNITDKKELKDSYDENGVITCGYCGKKRHGYKACWSLNGKPSWVGQRPRWNGGSSDKDGDRKSTRIRRCWICGSPDHMSYDCPNRGKSCPIAPKQEQEEDKDEEAQINTLFVGSTLLDTTNIFKKSEPTEKVSQPDQNTKNKNKKK